jgi:hypothetical protein
MGVFHLSRMSEQLVQRIAAMTVCALPRGFMIRSLTAHVMSAMRGRRILPTAECDEDCQVELQSERQPREQRTRHRHADTPALVMRHADGAAQPERLADGLTERSSPS